MPLPVKSINRSTRSMRSTRHPATTSQRSLTNDGTSSRREQDVSIQTHTSKENKTVGIIKKSMCDRSKRDRPGALSQTKERALISEDHREVQEAIGQMQYGEMSLENRIENSNFCTGGVCPKRIL